MNTSLKQAIIATLVLGIYSGVSTGDAISGSQQGTGTASQPIVLLGASYAKGLQLDEINAYTLVNKGVAGDTSIDMLDRFSDDVVALNPQKVILWGFINDIHNTDINEAGTAVEKIKASYLEMIERAQKTNIEPILVTEITMSRRAGIMEILRSWRAKLKIKPTYQDIVNGHVMAVNQWLKEYAEKHGLQLLDFQSLLAEGGVMRNKAYAQDDGGHLSEKGYTLLKDYLIENLR